MTKENPLEKLSKEPMDLTPLVNHICKYALYCLVKKTLNKSHCSKDYAKTCQTAKFYLKYGEKYNQMGVGC